MASLFSFFRPGARAESGGSGADRSPWGNFWFGGVPARAGRVTPDTAIRLVAVYACVRVLAESFAVLPFRLYRPRVGGGRQRVTEHWLHTLMCRAPNPYQTPFEWREMLQGHLAYRGNAYNLIIEDGQGGIKALVPMHPDSISVEAIGTDEWRYRRTLRDGSTQPLRRDQVWHLRGLGSDGIMGLSPITLAAESLGEAATFQDYSSTFFRNNGAPPAWVKVPGKFSDRAARESFREQIQSAQTGMNRGRFMVLDQGMELQSLQVSQRDMQFIEARAMKTTEIARLFRVPPHKIGDLSKATFSNIEQQAIEFWQDSIHPWCERWESSIECSLLGADTDLEVEFDMRGQMRGDASSRSTYIHNGVLDGWLTRNEGREMEGLDPIDGLDEPLVPLNQRGLGDPMPSPAGSAPAKGSQPDGEDDDTLGADGPTGDAAAPRRPARVQTSGHAAEARLHALLASVAGRVARRELGAMQRAQTRHGEPDAAFDAAMHGHAEHVAEAMAIDLASGVAYVAGRRVDASDLAAGVITAADFEATARTQLLLLACPPGVMHAAPQLIQQHRVMVHAPVNVDVKPADVDVVAHIDAPRAITKTVLSERKPDGSIVSHVTESTESTAS